MPSGASFPLPLRSQARITGAWEKVPDSGIWWIRYRENGALHLEKVGRKSDALALYQKRKSEIRAGAKLRENVRPASIRFGQLAEDIRRYSEKHHRDQSDIESRLKRILSDSENRLADQIKPEDINGWIARNTQTAAGARVIVAMTVGVRIVLTYGFEKKEQANIKIDELRAFRKAARVYLGYSEAEMTAIVRKESPFEIVEPSPGKGERYGKCV